MSQENVELVRRGYLSMPDLATDAGDEFDRAFRDYLDEQVEIRVPTGRASRVPIEMNNAHVVTILNGRIRSIQGYRDRQQALEAVGLRE